MLLKHRFTKTLVVIDLVTFQVLEAYCKTHTTLLLNMRTLRLLGNELFHQIGDNIPKAPLVFLTLQSTPASMPPSLHISLPKYVNWFASSTGCPFRTIALDRGCLVVDAFTILMEFVFPVLILSPKEADSFSSEQSMFAAPRTLCDSRQISSA